MGPCLCGDPYCSSCGGGAYDPPEECPQCGAANSDENGTMFDEKTDTCGDVECMAAERERREEWARQEHEAAMREDEAAAEWEREQPSGGGPRCHGSNGGCEQWVRSSSR